MNGLADSSLRYYRSALNLYRQYKGPPTAIMVLYAGVATRFVELGRYDSAHYYFHEGLRQAQAHATKDPYVIAMFYNNLSAIGLTGSSRLKRWNTWIKALRSFISNMILQG